MTGRCLGLTANMFCRAAPAVAEGFTRRCAALARLDGLPPIAPEAVRSLAATHRGQLRALLVDGPTASDPLAAARLAPRHDARSSLIPGADQPASSLDWQRAAAARRFPAAVAALAAGAGPPSPAPAQAAESSTAVPSVSQAAGRAQGVGRADVSSDILQNLEVGSH